MYKRESDIIIEQNEVVQIEGFTGVSKLTEGTVQVILELGDTVETKAHNFAVVPDEIIPNCCLLGMNFILRHNQSIDCAAILCLLNENVNEAEELLPCVQESEVLVTVVSTHTHTHTHVYIHIYLYIYMCRHIHIHMHIHIYTCK